MFNTARDLSQVLITAFRSAGPILIHWQPTWDLWTKWH